MSKSIHYSLFLLFVLALSSCGTAKKLQNLEERVAKLEREKDVLKRDVETLQKTLSVIQQNAEKKPAPAKKNLSINPRTIGINDASGKSINSGVASQIPSNATTITFEKTTHDFGELKEGESGEYTFHFTNTGEHPLTIENARASCGCTVPEWPKETIPVQGKGTIKVRFNTKGKAGAQNKSIAITANTNPTMTRIYIKANVVKQ